jgi:hypothetical protein
MKNYPDLAFAQWITLGGRYAIHGCHIDGYVSSDDVRMTMRRVPMVLLWHCIYHYYYMTKDAFRNNLF